MSSEVKVEGVKELLKALESLPDNIERSVLRRVLKGISSEATQRAKSKTPVDTGELRNSIYPKLSSSAKKFAVSLRIGTANSLYARFIERGFMHKGKNAAGRKRKDYAGKLTHMPARPFMQPTAEELFPEIEKRIGDGLAIEVPKALKRQAKKWLKG